MKQRRREDVAIVGGTSGRPPVRRVAMLSVHTSPLDQPGTGDGGGLNVYVMETGRRLAARGVEVDVFTRATGPGVSPAVEVVDRLTVRHVVAGPPAPLEKDELPGHLCSFLLGLERHVSDLGLDRDYDAVHSHYWLSGWVGRRLRERWSVPLVQSFHTLARVKNAALTPGDDPEPALRVLAEARIVNDADRIVVPVCGEARLLHRIYGTSGARLSVVRPGVDTVRFRPDGIRRLPAEVPDGDGPVLLFVGRLQPLKAPDVAIRTLAHVRREITGARLLIVGGTSGKGRQASTPAQLAELARDLGVGEAVTIVGARPQDELADLYRAADLLLVPSRSESFGLVALESQACGTPVVAADVGGLRAVVGPGGELVEGHDPRSHADAALRLLSDRRRLAQVTSAGIRHASASSWERTVDGLLDVYGDVSATVRERGVAGA